MKDISIKIIKGAIIGIANIIPGVSGGTMAVSLGLYDQLIEAVSNFFKNIKKYSLILLPILLGAGIGIILGGKSISYLLEIYHTQTILFFVGLILGGLNLISNKIKKELSFKTFLIFITVFFIVLMFNLMNMQNLNIINDSINFENFLSYILVGTLAGGGMIIPGISGSFILVLMGFYEKIINTLGDITNPNLLTNNFFVLIPFAIGCVLGIIIIAKIINYLLKKYEVKTYIVIFAFVCASIIILLLQIITINYNFISVSSYLITLILGFVLAKLFEKIK